MSHTFIHNGYVLLVKCENESPFIVRDKEDDVDPTRTQTQKLDDYLNMGTCKYKDFKITPKLREEFIKDNALNDDDMDHNQLIETIHDKMFAKLSHNIKGLYSDQCDLIRVDTMIRLIYDNGDAKFANIKDETIEKCIKQNVVIEDIFLHQYTHCDILCLSYGLPALTCPFASSNQAPRITFQTNQTKQAIGIPTFNHEHINNYNTYNRIIQRE
jgi:hypothetical protein